MFWSAVDIILLILIGITSNLGQYFINIITAIDEDGQQSILIYESMKLNIVKGAFGIYES